MKMNKAKWAIVIAVALALGTGSYLSMKSDRGPKALFEIPHPVAIKLNNSHTEAMNMECRFKDDFKGAKGGTNCNVFLGPDIVDIASYQQMITWLITAKANDSMTVYVAGNGGLVTTLITLNSVLQNTKAKTTTVLVGDSYSAHAAIALSGKNVVIQNKEAVLMFHRSSIYSLGDPIKYCKKHHKDKKDRRKSLVKKCIDYVKNLLDQDERAIDRIYGKYLTKAEIKAIKEGHDVFINAWVIHERMQTDRKHWRSYEPKDVTVVEKAKKTPLKQSSDTALRHSVMQKALKYKGMHEVRDRKKLKAFLKIDPVRIPWCTAFVNEVLRANGLKPMNSLLAKSYLKWGKATNNPVKGDIAVFNRTSNPQFGHVGFYWGKTKNGNYLILGGNQDNMVKIKVYPKHKLAGFRTLR